MGKKSLSYDYYKAPPYDVVLDPIAMRGRWASRFGRQAPLHVEIGMGLGHYLTTYAIAHPEMNHLGLEMKMHRIYTARQASLKRGLRNIRYVPGDASLALAAFAPGEITRLTLLFPDPWPKHPERRLTHPEFILRYRDLLAPGGHMHFRTDDPELFAYSLGTFEEAGFELQIAVPLERTVTGFERRWLREGRLIYGLDARLI